MYRLTHLKEVIYGLQQRTTQLKVIQDLLNAEVDCVDVKPYLYKCYNILDQHLPTFTSPTVKQAFILGVIEITQECGIDAFDFVWMLFEWSGSYSTEEFQNKLLSYPEYLPLLYTYKQLDNPSMEVINQSIREFVTIERNRDGMSFGRYSILLKLLNHQALDNVDYFDDEDQNGIDQDDSSNFIKYVLSHQGLERREIIDEHLYRYDILLATRQEYEDVLQAINILNEEKYEDDGWMPLPNMVLDKFMSEDTRITMLRHEQDVRK